jgi:ribonuclease Z
MDAISVKGVFWEKIFKIPKTSWTIKGYSRSAYRTGFFIPELSIMLDAGPQCFSQPNWVFITHTHIDHIACLPLTMIGYERGVELNICAPLKAKEYIGNYISSMFSLNAMSAINTDWYIYHGLECGNSFRLSTKKTKLQVNVFKCDHALPTISYGFVEFKDKLKQQYIELPGKDIAALNKGGVEITEEIAYKRFAYVCDTSIKVFNLNPDILTYPVIFIECTFLHEDDYQNALDTKHIHWSQLKPVVLEHPDIFFVLFHFSQRYRDLEIDEFFNQEKIQTPILTNIFWW